MVDRFIARIEPSLSPARLQRYATSSTVDLDAVVNYFWNIAIADSLYCCLNLVEIALRNALHRTLTAHFGAPNWYDHQGLLEPEQARQVGVAKQQIRNLGRPVTPDRVVATLAFGFWVTILSRNYDARLWRANRAANLRYAFPRVPKSLRQRVAIHARYNDIRELRNSAYHHEPLFDDPRLLLRHADVHDAIRWINPELKQIADTFDRFPAVFTSGRSEVETKLKIEIIAKYGSL